jgi:hypothetical protein
VRKQKKKSDNVLPFLARPRPKVEEEDPLRTTALFQIGSTRFAIHIWYEPLPPVPRQLALKPRTNTKTDLVLVREATGRSSRQPKAASRPHRDGRRKRKGEPVTVLHSETRLNGKRR